jgi:D-lactate dehydrogenase
MAYTIFYDTTKQDKKHLEEFLEGTNYHVEWEEATLDDTNIRRDAEVISVFVSSKVTRQHLEQMPNLKLIACRSTGYNNVDLHAAKERGVSVVNVPSYGNHTVAEYAFMLILALSRKLLRTSEAIKTGRVVQQELSGFDLNGKVFGIIGSGRIGQSSAKIAKAFGMEVKAFDPYPNEEAANEIGYSCCGLEEILSTSDVISLHAPLTDSNYHLLGDAEFKMMKDSAIVINTARGELIDTNSLIEALNNNQIAGAGLDVIEGEKLVSVEEEVLLLKKGQVSYEDLFQGFQISILEKMPNVILTPHNAFNTAEAIKRINEVTINNIKQYWSGEMPNKIEVADEKKVKTGKLVLSRHTESEWNLEGRWTGWADVPITAKGVEDAKSIGRELQGIKFDYAFHSEQGRTKQTVQAIIGGAEQTELIPIEAGEINERDYGDYTGKNKWEVKEEVGEEQFNRIRRDFDCPIPNGETLKDVYNRTVPFYKENILQKLLSGKNVLLVSSGNAIRSLMKYIEGVSDEDISGVEMPLAVVLIYDVDENGRMLKKELRRIDTEPTAKA